MAATVVANARMYSVTPAAGAVWRELLAWALARAGLHGEAIEHAAPAPLATLWARDDLALAFMCGLPWSQRTPHPTLVAAPVPSPARYEGRAIYFTDIAVHRDSRFETLQDTFGGVIGYTTGDSLSGAVALRDHLRQFFRGEPLYRASVGNLLNARGVIDALAAGRIDAGPLDSYSLDLLRMHDPAFAAQVRVVASARRMPIPPLVATAALPDDEVRALRDALQSASRDAAAAPLMERLLLAGFTVPTVPNYAWLASLPAQSPTFEELA